jgi:hypothetical protein
MHEFLSGMVVMGFAVASLLFLSFWRRTRQALFLTFAASFLLLGTSYAWLAMTDIPVEERSQLFLLRLLAFALIIVAIFQSNRAKRP